MACGSQAFIATLLLILRCLLFLSFRSRILIVLDCSPANRERELSLDRRETGKFYPTQTWQIHCWASFLCEEGQASASIPDSGNWTCAISVLVYPEHPFSRVEAPNRLQTTYVLAEVSYLVEQLPHCDLLRLIHQTERFVCWLASLSIKSVMDSFFFVFFWPWLWVGWLPKT